MTAYVRICPQCRTERSVTEIFCETVVDNIVCNWPLSDEPTRRQGQVDEPAEVAKRTGRACRNGHSVEIGDQICVVCGADLLDDVADSGVQPRADRPTEIDAWQVVDTLPEAAAWQRYLVTGRNDQRAVLTLYEHDYEPDSDVHDILRRMPRDHLPELVATGRWQGRAYEVAEFISGISLAEAGYFAADSDDRLRRILDELTKALSTLTDFGLRHRNISPSTVLLRTTEPLDLVVTDFGSARLSDFDLESVAPLVLTRYSSPEAIVGGVSAASDWWSLGMILLEHVTAGRCFDGINDKAFHIHVVTRGMEIPTTIAPSTRDLLRGLLSRDPLKRWQGHEVRRWLSGEHLELPPEQGTAEPDAGPEIRLGEKRFFRLDTYALAAAEAQNWEAARNKFLRGELTTWLEHRHADPTVVAAVRRFASDEDLFDDLRHALALMTLNASLPLIIAGEIVTPAWLLAHLEEGYFVATGPVSRYLQQMQREPWLVRLRSRAGAVLERAKVLEIQLDDARVRVAILASSRANLEAERNSLRALYPESDHGGLASLLESDRLTDEELIILISAAYEQFVSAESVLDNADQLAAQNAVSSFSRETAAALLVGPRRDIYAQVAARTARFARCPIDRINEWVDSFRIEHRISLSRAVVLLSIPQQDWVEPPQQQYLANLLEHFEKRVMRSVQRGPLVRFIIGKSTARIDLTELQTGIRPADAMLDNVVRRLDAPITLDGLAFDERQTLLPRLRRLVSHASTFRRDTGIDGRYLGFPFLVMRDSRLVSTSAKPRIAPILLWPVAIDLQPGTHGRAMLAFDRAREEVRVNPALEGLLGPEEFERWQQATVELLGRTSLRCIDVMNHFGALAPTMDRKLAALPSKDFKLKDGPRALVWAAALFNAEFTGQAIAADLRELRRRTPGRTALQAALKVGQVEPAVVAAAMAGEPFMTVDSDPSQSAAVTQARSSPGLLIEGPPGTGKSQTIVNIISDCIGRNETVLVVCQKQAALRVVEKRLEKEKLSDRLLAIVDVNRDREPTIRALRDQLDRVRTVEPGDLVGMRRARESVVARVSSLEADLDRHCQSLYAVDDLTGLSYRGLLAELIGLHTPGVPLPVPALRKPFATLGHHRITELQEVCGSVSNLWLQARYEGSPLQLLQQFSVDDGILGEFTRAFATFAASETKRHQLHAVASRPFEVDEPSPLRAWLDQHDHRFATLSDIIRCDLSRWLDYYKADRSGSTADRTLAKLKAVIDALTGVGDDDVDKALLATVATWKFEDVVRWEAASRQVLMPVSLIGRLNFGRFVKRRQLNGLLDDLGRDRTDGQMLALRDALALEKKLRGERETVRSIEKSLGVAGQTELLTVSQLLGRARFLASALQTVQVAAEAVLACPRITGEAEVMARAGTAHAYDSFRSNVEAAIERQAARTASTKALDALAAWFEDKWVLRRRNDIETGKTALGVFPEIYAALPTLAAYQRFRARAAELDPDALAVLAALRVHEQALSKIGSEELEEAVRRIIANEALLAYKDRIERAHPALLVQRSELERKVANLGNADEVLRQRNRDLLARDIDMGRLAGPRDWEAITRLRGRRTRRLREIIDEGTDLGLMQLRPVWLLTPDTVSQVLPLKAGQFDVVIFDEASQMLVEHAVPSLFRAKRAVISGDEKQMPPTSFFSARMGTDEDEDYDGAGPDDAVTESEREIYEETWNRREIKDCPDLLALGHSFLPTAILQIHYRSKYAELIRFSNAAFYQDRLGVPARHPDAEIKRVRPIDVIRVNGTYEDQTNQAEAERVVDVLAKFWTMPANQCPSIGIVSFNRKQADLVEDLIEDRADQDPAFLAAYKREQVRVQNEEDMGFFVKNVENVQGDERDVIIFSTTFGRDRQGSFKRYFGVLGQVGGERRLNVAVTRARERVVLVTSMPVNDISDMLATNRPPNKARDYLQAYLDYAEKVSAGEIELARLAARKLVSQQTHSQTLTKADQFVAAVAAYCRELGYTPVSARDDDTFGVDLAIEDRTTGQFGFAIECDPPRDQRGHLSKARAREIWRPQILRRAIPVVHRVTSYGWYHDQQNEKNRLRVAVAAALRGSS